ncbi:hypothetical protein Vretimale_16125 [Volvox reticuliferus]|uniref:C3H1-type domain-containing protein n=1 Tax=Volvox reticuliferus TaxID=1737510 RepID=A0A8J4GQG9_9CHLO|nr:hypothetical protein Vretifemale_9643 [Volvox reticuliferus]GIM12894.1 hypothetical protein Vretimale_16125 [Volvox reticuliferus]
MFGNNTNMYPNMMAQQSGGMMGQQLGVGQIGTQMSSQMAGHAGQQMRQLQSQFGSQMSQLPNQAGQQQSSMQQPSVGGGMMATMPGMGGMNLANMTGMTAAGAAGSANASAPGLLGQQGAGMMGAQGTGMMSQQGAGMMAQHGMNPANWQATAASNPQAMAAMQVYMQQYAMRMAAYQRMAAAASAGGMASMGGLGPMGAMGGMGPLGTMGPMGGMTGPMGAMGMMTAQMNQPQNLRTAQQQRSGMDGGENSRFWKTRICNKWKEGHCPYGDTCKYAHGDGDLRPPVMEGAKGAARNVKAEGAADKRTMVELMKKTRICEEFVRTGSCKYGDKCTFAHGQTELRQAPNTMSTQPQGSIHKTRLCERFMTTGSCPYGDKCTFAHGHHELRQNKPGAIPSGGAGGSKNQAQQKQKKQQKGDSGSGSAPTLGITGIKREREDATSSGGGAGDASGNGAVNNEIDEPSKRPHVASADGEGDEQQGQQEEEPQQLVAQDGDGEGRWAWGSSPSPKRDGGDGGDEIDVVEEQIGGLDCGDQQLEGGRRLEDAPSELRCSADGDGDLGSPSGGAAAAVGEGSDGTGGAAADGIGATAGTSSAPSAGGAEHECRLCSAMVKAGRDKMLAAVQQLSNPAAQKLGVMILGYGTPRFEQLWNKLSFGQLQSMLSKSEFSVADRIELLKAVSFHTHASDEEREKLESQKYVSQGLPPDVADFVAMVLDGKEGSTQMAEYFAALEVCKNFYGVTEDEYFNVSSTMANLFMNM